MRQGIESQPGPNVGAPFSHEKPGVLEVINISNMDTRSSSLLNREAHALAIGEHSIPACRVGEIRKRFNDTGWKGHLSPLDPEPSHNTAGVAGMARGPAMILFLRAQVLSLTFPCSLSTRIWR